MAVVGTDSFIHPALSAPVLPTHSRSSRRLRDVLGGRTSSGMKAEVLKRVGRVLAWRWANGEAVPADAESVLLEQITGGYVPKDGWAPEREGA